MSYEKLLTANEVSEFLQIDLQRVWSLTRKKLLPGIVILGERQYRYSKPAIERFIENGGNRESEVNQNEK